MQQYLDRHRFLKGIYLMVRRYFDHHVGRDSAALTYYLLFALFPLLIFLSNLVGIMSVDISGFLYEIRAFIPQEALEIIEQLEASSDYRARRKEIAAFNAGSAILKKVFGS